MRIIYDEYAIPMKELIRVLAMGYIGCALVLMLFYKSLILSLIGGLLAIYLVNPYKKIMCKKREELLQRQFKDFLYSISASIAAGRQMNSALEEAYENLLLIYPKDSPMCLELLYMNNNIKNNRGNVEDLLGDFALRSGMEDIISFANIYKECRRLGGDMEGVITRSNKIITEKISIMREIKMITSQKQFESRIIMAMPLVVIGGLNLFYPEYLSVLYSSFQGRILMTLALGGMVAAYVLMQKLMDIDV